jgi:signal peptidase II
VTSREVSEATGRHRAAFAGVAALVVALDQMSKHWALQVLDDGPIELVGSLRLKLTFNESAAFSLGGGRTTLIAAVGLVVAGIIVRLGLQAERRLWALGLGVVLGGALGNLVDRAFRAGDGILGGHVVDFVDLQWWPVFNVADTALWVGIGLLVLSSWREPEQR